GCPTEVAADLSLMALYDIAVLIDDSGTMQSREEGKRIPALKKGLKVIAEMYSKLAYADDGITPRGILAARFLNHNRLRDDAARADNLTAVALEELLQGHEFSGTTEIGTQLKKRILKPLVYEKLSNEGMRRPLLIMVITDGKIEGEKDGVLENNIRACIDHLKSLNKLHWVVFQFTRIGNDVHARRFLKDLKSKPIIKPYISV
ncbi:uncharacterized protein BDR25DRAFT_156335, partial [Lindgomyces ingoldianus]